MIDSTDEERLSQSKDAFGENVTVNVARALRQRVN